MPVQGALAEAMVAPPPGIAPRDIPLSDLGEIVTDGSLVTFSGAVLVSRPMAATRELIRRGSRDLGIVTGGGGIETDLLIRAGCVNRLIYGYISLGTFGVAPAFRSALKERSIAAEMITGHPIGHGLEAAARGFSYLPCHTDLDSPQLRELAADGRLCKIETCPFTGSETFLVRAIKPDFGIIHADAVDEEGNVVMGTSVGDALLVAMASSKAIVTYERRIAGRAEPSERLISRMFVDYTAHAPHGAWPTSYSPHYKLDPRWFIEYTDSESKLDPIKDIETTDEASYLASNGIGDGA